MTIEFQQTGDPWHDWGLCELYDVLLYRCQDAGSSIQVSKPGDAGFSVTTSLTAQRFGQVVGAQLSAADRWDALHPRFEEGKRLYAANPAPSKDGVCRVKNMSQR